jgi:AraC family transcriptional regulator of adaptative response/methylated-DNA-[protein]-cysteine methyltransferase
MMKVRLELATEVAGGGRIGFGFGATPFGEGLVAWMGDGVCRLVFVDEGGREEAEAGLRGAWEGAVFDRDDAQAAGVLRDVFEPGDEDVAMRVLVRGTDFQLSVWRALLGLEFGATTTYGRLAESIGKPGAARAVGAAVGANPLAYLIPCHRVVRGTGAMGGYRWGAERKRAMLEWEESRVGEILWG